MAFKNNLIKFVEDTFVKKKIKQSKNIKIYIKTMEGWHFPLNIMKTDLIINIKVAVEESIGVSLDTQRLVYNECILVDDLHVSEFEIKENSVICVIPVLNNEILVFLKFNEDYSPLILSNIGYVINVKEKVNKDIGVLLDEQILSIHGLTLEDHWAMDACYIIEGSIINLIKKSETNSFPLETIAILPNFQGICCIINNENFTDGNSLRLGTLKDEENIRNTFEALRFNVKVYSDISSKSISSTFKKIKSNIEKSHRMFIMFVLSHGNSKGVSMTDGNVLSFEVFWRPFTNKHFETLSGKPKLFFFVCCQGIEDNKGVYECGDSDIEFDDSISNKKLCPSIGDIFCGYSTCPYFKSCRSKSQGTSYVNCLCMIIQQNPTWSISRIHEAVQFKMTEKPIKNTTNFQMPYHEHLLRGSVHLVEPE